MKLRKDMMFAVLTTFCMSALMFAVIPIRSGLPNYDPWADMNDDGKINIYDVSVPAKLFGAVNSDNLTRDVNVTNWPQDRSLTIKKGVEKIALVQAMDGGTGNGYALTLDKSGSGQEIVQLVYDFEPKGQFVNVSEIYLNLIWRADVAGNPGSPHEVRMYFYNGTGEYALSDYVNLSPLGEPWTTMPTGPLFYWRVSQYKSNFNYALIQPGMNHVELSRWLFDSYGDHIYIFSLEMFFEYYYWG